MWPTAVAFLNVDSAAEPPSYHQKLKGPARTGPFEARSFVLASFAALSVLITYPLARGFASTLPAGSGDVWQNYWNYWWWKKALVELGQSPFFTDYLFYPGGTDLLFHTHSPFNMLAALPVTVYWGPAAAYNFSVYLALILSGYGAWLLGRELTGDGRAGFLAGLIFTFFPQHLEQTFEHVNLFSTQFIPWTLYYVVRWARRGGRGAAAGLGLCFALNALCSWHLGLILTLMMIPVGIAAALESERRPAALALDLAAAAALAALLLWPFVVPMLIEIAGGATYYKKEAVDRGIDPTFLLTPQFAHPLLGPLVAGRYWERAYGAAGFVCYLGVTPLVLAGLALKRKARGARLWAALALGAAILAIGARPYWNGRLIEDLALPYALLAHIPGLDVLRVANRFMVPASLGLAVAAAIGWRALGSRAARWFPAFVALILFEYLWTPFPVQEVAFAPSYQRMLGGPLLRVGAVLDIPFHQGGRSSHNMVAQTVHERRIAAGYMSTYPPEPLARIAREPALADLTGVPALERPIDFRRLVQLGFDTVVLHKYRADSYRRERLAAVPFGDVMGLKAARRTGGIPDEKFAEIRRQLEANNGPPAFEDDLVAIFYLKAAFPEDEAGEPPPDLRK